MKYTVMTCIERSKSEVLANFDNTGLKNRQSDTSNNNWETS